jgi:dephospho-CoA kinase
VFKLICITGLCGAGKSVVSDYLVDQKHFQFLRFGQLTLDEVKSRGLPPSESLEREIREDLRAKHGMAAFALLNLPRLDELIKVGNVVGDGLYSFEEYKVLKDHFGSNLIVISVYAPPALRYQRISARVMDKNDTGLRNRSLSVEDAKKRDFGELENLNKGATIAMADYTLLNIKDIDYLVYQLLEVLTKITPEFPN